MLHRAVARACTAASAAHAPAMRVMAHTHAHTRTHAASVMARFAAPARLVHMAHHVARSGAMALPRSAVLLRGSAAMRAIASRCTSVASANARLARFNSTIAAPGASSTSHSSSRTIGLWLLGTAGMVYVMVVLGGVTRLTRSGLSIVEWRAAGETLPRSEEEWLVEFDKYKQFPEFQRVNRHMSLEEFKPIYVMEWAHRMWGRAIGLAFALPFAYFAITKSIPSSFYPRLSALLLLGAAQGGIGWWMVRSGLEHHRFTDEGSVPRLGFAFTLYSALLWFGLDLLRAPALQSVTPAAAAAAQRIRVPVWIATGVIGATVASGAFVAGNDAGHAYNDWPLFAGRVVPEQIWDTALGMRNFFENTATVQFDHRLLAYASIAGVHGVWVAARKAGRAALPAPVSRGINILAGFVGLQALLGISTLMLYVPTHLAATHQAGALALLTSSLSLAHWTHVYGKAASVPQRQAGAVGLIPLMLAAASSAASRDVEQD